jgi:hypothetical protein
VLRSVRITAALSATADRDHLARFCWERRIELSLDCFVCERTGRTTHLTWGAERAVCSADKEHGPHFTAARIAAFDVTISDDGVALSAAVDFWWAPFSDTKRDTKAVAPTEVPWVRLHYSQSCPHRNSPGEGTIQTNLVRPCRLRCQACEQEFAVSAEAPSIRLTA